MSTGDVVTPPRRPHVVVVGGGISGLAAAWRLCRSRHDLEVTVLESSDRVGGKLRVGELAGLATDLGAESMLATRPEAVALARECGLGDDLVHPTDARPRLLVDGDLREMPTGLVMGVPTDLTALARSGVVSSRTLAQIPLDHVMPGRPVGDDVSLGEYVGRRLGPEVVDRLVAPLVMGVYADRAVDVSMRAAAPRLFEALRGERSLLAAASRSRGPATGVPAFAGIRGGVGRLPLALTSELVRAGARIETATTVRALRPGHHGGWDVVTGPTTDQRVVHADAVVLAVPAPATARLAKGLSIQAETELSEIQTTSVAVVSLAYRAGDLPDGDLPEGSGYLVPPSANRAVKAATFSSHKWQWVADAAAPEGLLLARCSLGHADDVVTLQRDDDELAALAADELAFVGRFGRARPVASVVTRWGGGLPRYAVGHVDRMERITEALHQLPGVAACGAAFDGVGIAACISRAGRAADWISQRLASDGQWRHG
ncbi:MAG TPA: protoporphyrinogen oxidase [Candidatus Nanopelagicales bacterium]|nr:protoporphyrinogen oxidase [Candidatus Nanopelagicales bacterium]